MEAVAVAVQAMAQALVALLLVLAAPPFRLLQQLLLPLLAPAPSRRTTLAKQATIMTMNLMMIMMMRWAMAFSLMALKLLLAVL